MMIYNFDYVSQLYNYTLADYLNAYQELTYYKYGEASHTFVLTLNNLTDDAIETWTPEISNAYVNNLWCHFIVPRYKDLYIVKDCAYDIEDDSGALEVQKAMDKWLQKFLNKIRLTYPRYKVLLDQYAAKEANLMAQVSTTTVSTSRFNDTPQDGGDWSDDSHTSNINQGDSTTTTDGATVMTRLAELRNEWDNLYQSWSDEFADLFMYGEVVEYEN